MAATFSGKFRAKHTPALLKKAKKLKDSGLTMNQIASRISQEHPELGGISPATASCWSRGLVINQDLKQEIRKNNEKRLRAAQEELIKLHKMSNVELALGLRDIGRKYLHKLTKSQHRRLVRLVKEILYEVKRETKYEREKVRKLFEEK